MKITIVGAGYVGLSLGVLLSEHHQVEIVDIVKEKVEKINSHLSPLKDSLISEYLKTRALKLKATLYLDEALPGSDFVIIATPTNYDEKLNYFDTSTVENVIKRVLKVSPKAAIVIKSTIPVGYVEEVRRLFKYDNIFFSPEFLREGTALYDNLYPSRIIIGEKSKSAQMFAHLLVEGAIKKDAPVLFMNPAEAEAVKLFANTYLAMRVTFFNELDTYAELRGLDAKSIIEGVGFDPRIGNHYNNPSFGYGGYCLPKDTKQLLANYENVPNNLIKAIVDGNRTRKEHIAKMILERKPKTVGVYRLVMKKGSENVRGSIMVDIVRIIHSFNVKVIVYEPLITPNVLEYSKLVNDFERFAKESDVIVTNRLEEELKPYVDKVYTRDIYQIN